MKSSKFMCLTSRPEFILFNIHVMCIRIYWYFTPSIESNQSNLGSYLLDLNKYNKYISETKLKPISPNKWIQHILNGTFCIHAQGWVWAPILSLSGH